MTHGPGRGLAAALGLLAATAGCGRAGAPVRARRPPPAAPAAAAPEASGEAPTAPAAEPAPENAEEEREKKK
jgi:hypothetical protein